MEADIQTGQRRLLSEGGGDSQLDGEWGAQVYAWDSECEQGVGVKKGNKRVDGWRPWRRVGDTVRSWYKWEI